MKVAKTRSAADTVAANTWFQPKEGNDLEAAGTLTTLISRLLTGIVGRGVPTTQGDSKCLYATINQTEEVSKDEG